MYHCKSCKVNINKYKNTCPICENTIIKIKPSSRVFPYIKPRFTHHFILIKILRVILFSSIFISLFLNYFINNEFSWSIYIILAVFTIYYSIKINVQKGKDIYKILFNEFNLIIFLSLVWDYYTGFYKWSINYVIPLSATVFLIFLFILSLFNLEKIKEHFFQLLFTILISILPASLIFFKIINKNNIILATTAINIYIITFIFVFNINFIKKEIIRKFHF